MVGSDRLGFAEAVSRNKIRLDALRDHVMHHVVGPFLRQSQIGRDALLRQSLTYRRAVAEAVHIDLRGLVGRQDRCNLGNADRS